MLLRHRSSMHEPLTGVPGPTHTMVANSVCAAVHLYHVLAFKLSKEDIFHHLTFATILCGLAIPFKQVCKQSMQGTTIGTYTTFRSQASLITLDASSCLGCRVAWTT